jgi:NAD-dependent SIR2 family protein deacetylase
MSEGNEAAKESSLGAEANSVGQTSSSIGDELTTAVIQGHVIPFLGAGASIESGLPRASELAKDLIASGVGNEGLTLEEVAEVCHKAGGWQAFARALPLEEWRGAQCNEGHRRLAEMCKEGLFAAVLTTNWDTLIENALNQAGLGYAPILRPASWNK